MMKRIVSLIFLAIAIVAIGFASDYLDYIERADKAIAQEQWYEAEQYLREAMTTEPSNPNNVMLLSNVGMLQFYRGEDSLALHTLSEARAIAPASVVILKNRARVLQQMGRDDDAVADYAILIEMDSTCFDAYFNRGYIMLMRGDTVAARADFEQLERLKPDDPNTLLALAVMYSNLNHPAEAIPYYSRLLEKQVAPEYYAGRAMCYLITEQLAEASDDIARGLELDPGDGELYYCRAYLNILRYREEDARADGEKAVANGVAPERVEALF